MTPKIKPPPPRTDPTAIPPPAEKVAEQKSSHAGRFTKGIPSKIANFFSKDSASATGQKKLTQRKGIQHLDNPALTNTIDAKGRSHPLPKTFINSPPQPPPRNESLAQHQPPQGETLTRKPQPLPRNQSLAQHQPPRRGIQHLDNQSLTNKIDAEGRSHPLPKTFINSSSHPLPRNQSRTQPPQGQYSLIGENRTGKPQLLPRNESRTQQSQGQYSLAGEALTGKPQQPQGKYSLAGEALTGKPQQPQGKYSLAGEALTGKPQQPQGKYSLAGEALTGKPQLPPRNESLAPKPRGKYSLAGEALTGKPQLPPRNESLAQPPQGQYSVIGEALTGKPPPLPPKQGAAKAAPPPFQQQDKNTYDTLHHDKALPQGNTQENTYDTLHDDEDFVTFENFMGQPREDFLKNKTQPQKRPLVGNYETMESFLREKSAPKTQGKPLFAIPQKKSP